MDIKDMFDVGEIMEWEDKDKSIKALDDNDALIMSKALNKKKIILYMKRLVDGSEGNLFVKLKDEFQDQFTVSKKLFVSNKVNGLTLGQFKDFNLESL